MTPHNGGIVGRCVLVFSYLSQGDVTMFDSIMKRSRAIDRHRKEPLAELRHLFLTHCAAQGMKQSTLSDIASYLLVITKYLRLGTRANELISAAEIEAAAKRWTNRRSRPANRPQQHGGGYRVYRYGKRWLQFMGRLQPSEKDPPPYADRVAGFAVFQTNRGLSPQTIDSQCHLVQRVMDRLCGDGRRLEEVTAAQVDVAMGAQIHDGKLRRTTIRTYVGQLRGFFRYAAIRNWCRKGLAEAILAPRVYSQETIPAGPSRNDVQRLLAATEGNRPTDIRDRAILMLLMVYGFRSGEVRCLQLEDLDWEGETIRVRRSKDQRSQIFPLSHAVGDAILRYIKEVRPRSPHRYIFLSRKAPIQPLSRGVLWKTVASRLRPLGVALPHCGPHALRHACATHLLEQGYNMKEIGDYLGHRCAESTRVYTKVDLNGLRLVANFSLEGLL
jgi:site-specific recombinase XerD